MNPLPPLTVPRPSAVGALLACAAPGLGHWWIGRARRGLLLFVVGATGANFVAVALLFSTGDVAANELYIGVPLAFGAWAWSVVDGVRLAWFARAGRLGARRREELAEGARLLEAGDARAARSAFARAAAADDCDPRRAPRPRAGRAPARRARPRPRPRAARAAVRGGRPLPRRAEGGGRRGEGRKRRRQTAGYWTMR